VLIRKYAIVGFENQMLNQESPFTELPQIKDGYQLSLNIASKILRISAHLLAKRDGPLSQVVLDPVGHARCALRADADHQAGPVFGDLGQPQKGLPVALRGVPGQQTGPALEVKSA
jgi:hypothetical protein